jgi:hypothetical protein
VRATTQEDECWKKAKQEWLVKNMINTWNHLCPNDALQSYIQSDTSRSSLALLWITLDRVSPLLWQGACVHGPGLSSRVGLAHSSLFPDVGVAPPVLRHRKSYFALSSSPSISSGWDLDHNHASINPEMHTSFLSPTSIASVSARKQRHEAMCVQEAEWRQAESDKVA